MGDCLFSLGANIFDEPSFALAGMKKREDHYGFLLEINQVIKPVSFCIDSSYGKAGILCCPIVYWIDVGVRRKRCKRFFDAIGRDCIARGDPSVTAMYRRALSISFSAVEEISTLYAIA